MFIGRGLVLEYPTGTVIAGVRTRSFTVDASPIDVTTDDEAATRTLLEESGQEQIDASVEGLLKDDTLLAQILNGTLYIQELTIKFPFAFTTTQATLVGDFRFNNFEIGAEYQDAVSFSAAMQSASSWVFTPAT